VEFAVADITDIEWSSLPFDCLTISYEQREVIMALAEARAEADAESRVEADTKANAEARAEVRAEAGAEANEEVDEQADVEACAKAQISQVPGAVFDDFVEGKGQGLNVLLQYSSHSHFELCILTCI
jgi:hypothetical protein